MTHVQRQQDGQRFWTRPADLDPDLSLMRRIRRRLRPLRTNWRQFRTRCRLKYRYHVLRHRPPKQLFVIAEGRTGSNLLVNYLGSVPGVVATEEVLNARSPIGLRRWGVTKGTSLRHIRYSTSMPGEIAVAKLPPHQMRWHNLSAEDVCEVFPEASFVVLYRSDLFSQYVSWCRLFLTGQERYRPGQSHSNEKLVLDVDHFAEFVRRTKQTYGDLSRCAFLKERSVAVSYEELSDQPQEVFDERIFPLLGVDSVPVVTQLKKQEAAPLSERVANYEEIADQIDSSQQTLTFEWST